MIARSRNALQRAARRRQTIALVALTVLAVCALVAARTFEWSDWATFGAAVPAGIGGVLLGDRLGLWLQSRGWGRQ